MSLIIPSQRGRRISTQITADGSYDIPNGILIDTIELIPSADIAAAKIGTTPGGEEILPEQALTGGETSLIGTLIKGPQSIYFTGITASMQVFFYKK